MSREDLQKDYQIVFGSEEGRRVLADLRNKSGFDTTHMLFTDERKQVYVAGSAAIFRHIIDNIEPKQERQKHGESNTPDEPDFGY